MRAQQPGGKYPVLDYYAGRRLGWWRQAGLFLFCIVISLIAFQKEAVCVPLKPRAETSQMAALENVFITHESYKEKGSLLLKNVAQCLVIGQERQQIQDKFGVALTTYSYALGQFFGTFGQAVNWIGHSVPIRNVETMKQRNQYTSGLAVIDESIRNGILCLRTIQTNASARHMDGAFMKTGVFDIYENIRTFKISQRRLGNLNAAPSKITLTGTNRAQNDCSNDKPEGKTGNVTGVLRKFLGIDGKLSRVFRYLPIYLQLCIGVGGGGVACILYGVGFSFIDRRMILLGSLFLLLGAFLFLGDGLVVRSGPGI